MKNHEYLQPELNKKRSHGSVGLDPLTVLKLLKKNWYWLVAGMIIGLVAARFYISHTMPVYQTTATILVNESESRPLVDNTALLQGLGLPGGMQNQENQIMILKSRDLIEKTLRELPFDVEFYFKTFRNRLPIYPESPLRLRSENELPLPKNIEFSIDIQDSNSFNIVSQSEYFTLNKTASFGDKIEISGGNFWIECRDEEWIRKNSDRILYFIVHGRNSLVNSFGGRMNVELLAKGGSILKISVTGTNPTKDADFLNKHLEGFQNISLDKKNSEAERRIQFIDDQLVGVSDSLLTTENRLQQFRSAHQVMDLSAQGQALIGQVTLLENERARLNLEANYYDYLAEYLTKDVTGEIPIVPITMGITDPGLTRLVDELAVLQGQLSAKGAGEMNPLQRNLEQRVGTTKDALKETLNGLRRANSLARSENQEQINRANSRASALPATERQLLGIERKFRLNNELYTFLLETRAEQQMQKASNRADSEIVDKADPRFSTRISPDKRKVQFTGLLAGVGAPFIVILLVFLFNNKVKEDDLNWLTDIPVVGKIPHHIEDINTVVFESPNSGIAESFRLLRSRIQFLTKEAKSPVILITSAMPGDGKTFTSINIASVYSILGKKTVLVGFDLRKPRIFRDFKLSNDKGVSTWLIGKDKLTDIIQETSFENLSVISAGPIPPNPSELIALEKTGELIGLLRERFDYIILDASPIGIVSDTMHLTAMVDACLLIVRYGKTMKDIFQRTINGFDESSIKGLSLVINDVPLKSTHYGYGEKYGYTNDKGKHPKNTSRRRSLKS